jgi:2-polyprenyl-3-methyl-5-hydroxy-6-metoxy-1,4-benzoquinol methylase
VSRREPVVEQGVIAGNYSDKHETRNPIVRWLVAGFNRNAAELAARTGAREVHEVGCGEGVLSRQLAEAGFLVLGTDFSEQIVEIARARAAETRLDLRFEARDVRELDPAVHAAELVVCCEVLEHLEDPDGALDVLSRLAKPWLLASVPREPLWRALNCLRGRYLGSLGNTPGHLQHWSRRGFLRFLARRFDVIEVRAPLPWTMALCRVADPE